MFTDILVAFAVALMINMFAQMGKLFKQLLVFVACGTLLVVYFIQGTPSFLGELDFSAWLLFLIIFDILISRLEQRLIKYANRYPIKGGKD